MAQTWAQRPIDAARSEGYGDVSNDYDGRRPRPWNALAFRPVDEQL
jgi:hypothetical protein